MLLYTGERAVVYSSIREKARDHRNLHWGPHVYLPQRAALKEKRKEKQMMKKKNKKKTKSRVWAPGAMMHSSYFGKPPKQPALWSQR